MARYALRAGAVLAGALLLAMGCAIDGTTDAPTPDTVTTLGDSGQVPMPIPFERGELLLDTAGEQPICRAEAKRMLEMVTPTDIDVNAPETPWLEPDGMYCRLVDPNVRPGIDMVAEPTARDWTMHTLGWMPVDQWDQLDFAVRLPLDPTADPVEIVCTYDDAPELPTAWVYIPNPAAWQAERVDYTAEMLPPYGHVCSGFEPGGMPSGCDALEVEVQYARVPCWAPIDAAM
jgi:hypothetical protein